VPKPSGSPGNSRSWHAGIPGRQSGASEHSPFFEAPPPEPYLIGRGDSSAMMSSASIGPFARIARSVAVLLFLAQLAGEAIELMLRTNHIVELRLSFLLQPAKTYFSSSFRRPAWCHRRIWRGSFAVKHAEAVTDRRPLLHQPAIPGSQNFVDFADTQCRLGDPRRP